MHIKGYYIVWQDIVMVLAFIMYFGAGFCTNFAVAEIGKYTEYAEQLEANPTARAALDFRYGLLMLQLVSVAILGGLYWMLRRNFIQSKNERSYLMFSTFTIYLFIIFLQNFLNDLPIALKLWLGG